MHIKSVKINNFRTLLNFEMEFDSTFQIIAGANNSGKSNLLRALNIFFNEGYEDSNYFEREKDLSYHILKGTGSISPAYIQVDLFLEKEEIKRIKGLDKYIHNKNIVSTIAYYDGDLSGWYHSNSDGSFPVQKELKKGQNEIVNYTHPIYRLFKRTQFIYIPAQYDISSKINKLVADDILPSMVDTYGNTGLTGKVKDLKKKIDEVDELTKKILEEKNSLISESFRNVLREFPEIQAGMKPEDYSLEVALTGESLTEILSKRIALNVKDAAHVDVDSKGSGIQKLILITLLEYFSKDVKAKARYTNPFIIWAIDEPETYMQPKLQKKIREIFNDVSKTHQVICTTHSPKMVDIDNPSNVKLFCLENREFYVSRKHKNMFKKITNIIEPSDNNFVTQLKDHFGVEKNDGWLVGKNNIIFEGNDDPIYFYSTYKTIMGRDFPNVHTLVCGGSGNLPAYVELLDKNMPIKNRKIICLLDHDEAGIQAKKKILKKTVKVIMTKSLYLTDKEDINENYPSMIEDLAIPELLFQASCEYLAECKQIVDKRKYTFKNFQKLRFTLKKLPITEVMDIFFQDIRSQIHSNFSFTNLQTKYAIAVKYGNLILELAAAEKQKLKIKHPKLEKFFKEFEK